MPMLRKKNEDFFKTWTSSMAYVLGFFAADGAMTKGKRGNCYIEFTSKDLDHLILIRKEFSSENKIARSHVKRREECYRLQIGSKAIFQDLVALGFSERKSLRLSLPDIPPLFFRDFIRGYFDGDGSIWVGKTHKGRVCSSHAAQVLFTSGSESFLMQIEKAMSSIIGHGRIVFHENAYRLMYSTLPSLSLYKFMYNNATLYLARKKEKFESFIRMRL